MPVDLAPVTSANWRRCVDLRVRPDQKNLVASNLYSLAQAKVIPTMNPAAISADGAVVGFCMYGIDPEDGRHWIWRLMVDARHQGKGYGRAAMVEILRRLALDGAREIYTSFDAENTPAERLYRSLGFCPTGMVIGGETVVRLDLPGSEAGDSPAAPSQVPVVVWDYYPGWPLVFQALAQRVRRALGRTVLAVEHVGSTSIPGCAAKPIIDMDAVVKPAQVPAALRALARAGYVHAGDQGVPGREVMKPPTGDPNHHLYVCPSDSRELARHLAFRDYLRRHPDEVSAYSALKRRLAQNLGVDRQAYTDAKSAFIERILRLAGDPGGRG